MRRLSRPFTSCEPEWVRPDRDTIGGQYPVEIDETLIGGRTRGEGRGIHHKATVVGAVEVRPRREGKDRTAQRSEGKPLKRAVYAGRLRLRLVSGRGAEDLTAFVKETVSKGATVRTDGWQGYDGPQSSATTTKRLCWMVTRRRLMNTCP